MTVHRQCSLHPRSEFPSLQNWRSVAPCLATEIGQPSVICVDQHVICVDQHVWPQWQTPQETGSHVAENGNSPLIFCLQIRRVR